MKRDQCNQGDHPFWVDGEMMLRVEGSGDEADRVVRIKRPFALVGQAADNDVRVAAPAASARHAYLHLDGRGLFVIDLVTRTGTKIDGTNRMFGWLRPGQGLEVAGRRIELLRARIDGVIIDPPPCDDEMLSGTAGTGNLAGVSLVPKRGKGRPWEIGSELVFLGWSASCGIQVRDASAARAHCALVRTPETAFVVDLCGHHTWVDDRPVRGVSALCDGRTLTIGSTSFLVRVASAPKLAPRPSPGREVALTEAATLIAHVVEPEEERRLSGSTALSMIPAESQRALLAWVLEEVRGSHGEAIRQQGEMQVALAGLIHQIQQDNARLLDAHLARIEKVDRELAQLRAELSMRTDATSQASAKPVRPSVPPLRVAPMVRASGDEADSKASTAWILERVSQLEQENRSTWREMLSRFTQAPRRAT